MLLQDCSRYDDEMCGTMADKAASARGMPMCHGSCFTFVSVVFRVCFCLLQYSVTPLLNIIILDYYNVHVVRTQKTSFTKKKRVS